MDAYFQRTGLGRHGGSRMARKTAVVFTWAIASYALLLWGATSWWAAVPVAVSLGLALAAIGFNVMHDGNHGAYSSRSVVNAASGASLDLIGGSSYIWKFKHNVHHTYPNVEGVDDDLELHPMVRIIQSQQRYWYHRVQVLYWVPLFVFLTAKWTFIDDFVALARGKVGNYPLPRPRGRQLALLLAGKGFCIGWVVILPLSALPADRHLILFAIAYAVWGVTLSMVALLGHAVDSVQFARLANGESSPVSWIDHQIATSTDFARASRWLTWYVGALNFQVEHHLFPRVSHVHYPAIAPIVREVCGRHGVTVNDQPTLRSAVRSHFRHMSRMAAGGPARASYSLSVTAPGSARPRS